MSVGIRRTGFTFYASFYNALHMEHVSDSDRLRLYDAIAEYSLFLIEPNFSDSSMLQMAWLLIEPTLSSSMQKSVNGAKAKGCPKPSMIGNKNASKQSGNKAELEQKQTNIDKDIDIDVDRDIELEELEMSDRHFVHSLGIKDDYPLFAIACKVVGMGFANGSYRSNKQNFLNKCKSILSYMGKYNVSVDEWSQLALEYDELSEVCTDRFFKDVVNRIL